MSAPTRILEVSSYPPPPSGWSVRIQFLTQQLRADGHTCLVLNIGASRTVPSDEYITVLGPVDYLRKLWRYSRQGFRVHAHTNGHSPKGLLLALVALAANRAAGVRPVLTFHGGAEQSSFPRDRAPAWAPAFRLLFRLASRIICNSPAVAAGIEGYGVPAAKIAAIPAFSRQYLAAEPVCLPDDVERFYGRWPRVLFTYIRLRAVFHPETLLDAVARVLADTPDAGVLVCGVSEHAEPEASRAFHDAVERHGLGPRLLVLDHLERDAFLTALRRSAVCLRTPTTDGVSSSVLEALALRVPVVASENGHRPAGVVTYPATDAAALADRILHVLAHRDAIAGSLPRLDVEDTLSREIALLTQ